MQLGNEYLKTKCIYCGKATLREKQQGDWGSDEVERGRHEPANKYYICDSCKRSCCSMQGVTITTAIVTVGQYYLWHFLR